MGREGPALDYTSFPLFYSSAPLLPHPTNHFPSRNALLHCVHHQQTQARLFLSDTVHFSVCDPPTCPFLQSSRCSRCHLVMEGRVKTTSAFRFPFAFTPFGHTEKARLCVSLVDNWLVSYSIYFSLMRDRSTLKVVYSSQDYGLRKYVQCSL